jgi:RimJ/RimL family protein N-acetyltransferase
VVGIFWTLIGGFDGFYSGLPIFPNDAVFLAGETFSEFRGRNVMPTMMSLVLLKLKEAGVSRVYAGSHVKNAASKRTISKVFKRLGTLRSLKFCKWHIAIWDKNSIMMDYK